MVVPELEQQLLQLSPDDKLYIIQLLAQSLTTDNNNTQPVQTSKISELFRQFPVAELPEEFDLTRLLKTLIESLQPATLTKITEYPLPQFYGCIQDETFFRHPQEQQPEREPIL
ncbi:MAG: hypothetical protein RMY64_32240 [Nostoc sp. DedQUE08]|uniref:hypothetical protein n=1 Tax=unclassified Nostoc TaxID=2593658 RepID=UPI002AD3799A|nr:MULTISPECIES: hypothetical protein [unclassified Nostoc]MDZ8070225.1 hypothetical protein [Nostoc sp. DedQUE08]MDZ8090639.1 hypothetical protein [Nostoc sp. DedQUE05]